MSHVKYVTFDTGQHARVYDDGVMFVIEYECSNCQRFTDDGHRHSHFDGERWRPGYYCGDCIELAI